MDVQSDGMEKERRDEMLGEMLLESWDGLDRDRIARMLGASWEEVDDFLQDGREKIEILFFLPETGTKAKKRFKQNNKGVS